MTAVESPHAEVLERLANDSVFYAENLAKIVPKQKRRGVIPLIPNEGQLALDAKLEEQRLAGRPQMALILKSRQVGFSTWAQLKLIQRSTLHAHHAALVIAHDAETGGKLHAIGERIYSNLPDDAPEIKPPIRSRRRARFMHFAQPGDVWMTEPLYPDSTYWVDTAGEFESGRGGTYDSVHFSEFAFFPQPEQKYVAIAEAIPESPDSLWIIESTANGHNMFKDLWDDAMEGRSDFIPFFWPWWKHDEYRQSMSAEEKAEFGVGDTDQSPYAEEEPELVDPGPLDPLTGEHVPLTLEQLKWRRWRIANRSGGSIDKFNQENPTTPTHAFLATGSKVFDPTLVSKLLAQTEQTDPRVGAGGPIRGMIDAGDRPLRAGRLGKIQVPVQPEFKPARELLPGQMADWRIWGPTENDRPKIPEDGLYVVGTDVSAGISESEDDEADPAYHAIEVIDHRTKQQIAEYRSRCDPDLLAEHAILTAELFNDAWLAVEVTGGWGLPIARKVWLDYRYRFMYFRHKHEHREETQQDRLGWDTNRATKPILLAGGQELLREGTHGIKSRRLAGEMLTYIRLSSGKTCPEKGKFADLLMAYLIAQQVALELPLRQMKKGKKAEGYRPRNRVTGYGVGPFLILDQLLGRF